MKYFTKIQSTTSSVGYNIGLVSHTHVQQSNNYYCVWIFTYLIDLDQASPASLLSESFSFHDSQETEIPPVGFLLGYKLSSMSLIFAHQVLLKSRPRLFTLESLHYFSEIQI